MSSQHTTYSILIIGHVHHILPTTAHPTYFLSTLTLHSPPPSFLAFGPSLDSHTTATTAISPSLFPLDHPLIARSQAHIPTSHPHQTTPPPGHSSPHNLATNPSRPSGKISPETGKARPPSRRRVRTMSLLGRASCSSAGRGAREVSLGFGVEVEVFTQPWREE